MIGRGKALELLLTGDMINAQEAYRIGLVNQVVPAGEVLKAAQGLAKKIASRSAIAISAILDCVDTGLKMSLSEGLLYEADKFASLLETEDMHEGVRAFLEKRQPQFKDR
jgi:enoyl-CoA hydratase/carnithine racemase